VTSQRKVHSNGRDRGRLAGGADVAADRTISWRFQAGSAGAPGAQNRQWEKGRFFEILPGSSGFFRFLTNRRKLVKLTRHCSCAGKGAENSAPWDRRRKIPSFSTAIAAQS